MNEFELIDAIVAALGPATRGANVVVGPGDDAAAVKLPGTSGSDDQALVVSSIDSLVAGVHFPARAPADLVGYRAMMVSLSDLAAMGAAPSHVLVSLTLEQADVEWATALASGMREACEVAGAPLVGGNITRGQCAIHVSVHGSAPAAQLLQRRGARAGESIFVTGVLGGAAAAIERGDLALVSSDGLDLLAERYFHPSARLGAGIALRGKATSVVDVSDGLLQDLSHLAAASGLCACIDSARVPVCEGATQQQALTGGDDYELLFTAAADPGDIGVEVRRIGEMCAGSGIKVDGQAAQARGYQHFS